MKILIAGDIHMDTNQVAYLINVAKKTDCSVILNVGDFGYWPHIEEGKKYLRKVNRMLEAAGINLLWIDGNHENFTALFHAEYDPEHGMVPILSDPDIDATGIYYVPRGHAWEWDGVKFLAMGGAASIDREWRLQEESRTGKPGTLYWPQERITDADIERGLEKGAQQGVDVLLLHDAPSYVQIPRDLMNVSDKAIDLDSRINRQRLSELVEGLYIHDVTPRIIFHGHFHCRHSIPYARPGLIIPCIGLDMNGSGNSGWYLLDTEKFNEERSCVNS